MYIKEVMGTIIRCRDVGIMIRIKDHEPPHVHAIRGDGEAKIEIITREVVFLVGFSKNDLKRIQAFIARNEALLMEAWNEIHEEES